MSAAIDRLLQLRHRINQWVVNIGFPADWYLIPLAALIGGASGLAAVGYGKMVQFSEKFFFPGGVEGERGALHWSLILVLPVTGAAMVGIIKWLFKLPRISHGLPEVIEAMARKGGRLQLRAGLFTALNSALTIGSGGSVGQEGPIVHIGSVVGSKVGQLLRVSKQHMGTLVGCGAAAGLAAIFNAPIAGVLLVLEVILRDFSLRTLKPVVIGSVFGVAVSQAILGRYDAVFALPRDTDYHFVLPEALPFLVLGVLCAMAGVGFSKLLYAMEHAWERVKILPQFKPAMGALAVGLMGLALVLTFPRFMPEYKPPAFMGNGYPVIEEMLTPHWYTQGPGPFASGVMMTLLFLLVIAVGKLVGTSMTLGSGGSGGVFAPALFMGAALGGAFGVGLGLTGMYTETNPALYALAGMAGLLSAAVHCPLTAIILVFEITQDYKTILPTMLVAIAANFIAQVMQRDSIYTQALRERGIRMGSASDLTMLRRLDVARVPLSPAVLVAPTDPLQRLLDLAADYSCSDYVVCDADERFVGMVVGEDVRTALLQREAIPLMVVGELVRTDLPTIRRDETLDVVLDKFSRYDVASLAVVDESMNVLGVMTRSSLMRVYQEALDEAA